MASYIMATHLCLLYNSNRSLILLIQSMTKYKYNKIVLLIYYSVLYTYICQIDAPNRYKTLKVQGTVS